MTAPGEDLDIAAATTAFFGVIGNEGMGAGPRYSSR